MMNRKHIILACLGGAALIAMTATASALITRESITNDKPVSVREVQKETPFEDRKRVAVVDPSPAPPPMPAQQPACDDGNIAGTVLGGAAGGVIGSQIGDGSGQTAATIAGVAGGALLGREYIPTRNITCAQK